VNVRLSKVGPTEICSGIGWPRRGDSSSRSNATSHLCTSWVGANRRSSLSVSYSSVEKETGSEGQQEKKERLTFPDRPLPRGVESQKGGDGEQAKEVPQTKEQKDGRRGGGWGGEKEMCNRIRGGPSGCHLAPPPKRRRGCIDIGMQAGRSREKAR